MHETVDAKSKLNADGRRTEPSARSSAARYPYDERLAVRLPNSHRCQSTTHAPACWRSPCTSIDIRNAIYKPARVAS